LLVLFGTIRLENCPSKCLPGHSLPIKRLGWFVGPILLLRRVQGGRQDLELLPLSGGLPGARPTLLAEPAGRHSGRHMVVAPQFCALRLLVLAELVLRHTLRLQGLLLPRFVLGRSLIDAEHLRCRMLVRVFLRDQ